MGYMSNSSSHRKSQRIHWMVRENWKMVRENENLKALDSLQLMKIWFLANRKLLYVLLRMSFRDDFKDLDTKIFSPRFARRKGIRAERRSKIIIFFFRQTILNLGWYRIYLWFYNICPMITTCIIISRGENYFVLSSKMFISRYSRLNVWYHIVSQ